MSGWRSKIEINQPEEMSAEKNWSAEERKKSPCLFSRRKAAKKAAKRNRGLEGVRV